jgi:class 3 adenylate cyclase
LRIFVPLRSTSTDTSGPITGYFEGVRVVPKWQEEELFESSLTVALMVCLASLLCGVALYPVVVHLSADNESKAKEVLDSQAALIEGLQRSERELEDKVNQRTLELQQTQIRTKELLHNILPIDIAEELSVTGNARPARHESVTILFSDFSGFTQAVSAMPAARLVAELDEIFVAFDDITDECGVEKIKTIGDAYMAAAGIPKACSDHAQRCVRAGLRMAAFLENRNRTATFKWLLRVGIHSGPVVAGVVGKRKYAFDIWGNTVNIASRMESSGEIGRVNISAYTYDLVRQEFECEYRGKLDAKGKGNIDMYFVKGALPG